MKEKITIYELNETYHITPVGSDADTLQRLPR